MHRDLQEKSPKDENALETLEQPRKRHRLYRAACSRVFHVAALSGLLILLEFFGGVGSKQGRNTTPSLGVPDRILHSWAEFSPYFPADKYTEPYGCTITQVNILQRHGASPAAAHDHAAIRASIANLKKATAFYSHRLDFIKTYSYEGTEAGRPLAPFGAAESYDAGQEAFDRYFHLVSKNKVPFVRSSDGSRVVDSATNWTAGFIRASGGAIVPATPLTLSEAANNTLADYMCDDPGNPSPQGAAWRDIFAPVVAARISIDAPGAKLTNVDIINLMSLCPLESVAKRVASPWCKVFDQQEFDDFEYFGDLNMYYKKGYGQPLGPVQGVGYVNEMLARLTGSPVNDSTQTNTTLTESPATFPLDRTLYADFAHHNLLVAVYAAMGIMRPATNLDPTYRDPHRTWIASRLVPYSGRLVTERLYCEGRGDSVRMLIDDAVVPLEICGAGKDGMCTLDAFVESQAYARNNGEGDWEKCYIRP